MSYNNAYSSSSSSYDTRFAPARYQQAFREAPQSQAIDLQAAMQKVIDGAKRVADACACIMSEDYLRRKRGRPYSEEVKRKGWARQLLTVVLLLQVVWVYTLYWGERSIYSSAIEACDWRYWERWVYTSSPHTHYSITY